MDGDWICCKGRIFIAIGVFEHKDKGLIFDEVMELLCCFSFCFRGEMIGLEDYLCVIWFNLLVFFAVEVSPGEDHYQKE